MGGGGGFLLFVACVLSCFCFFFFFGLFLLVVIDMLFLDMYTICEIIRTPYLMVNIVEIERGSSYKVSGDVSVPIYCHVCHVISDRCHVKSNVGKPTFIYRNMTFAAVNHFPVLQLSANYTDNPLYTDTRYNDKFVIMTICHETFA